MIKMFPMLLPRTIRLLVGGSPGRLIVYLILIIITSLLPVLQVWLMKQVVDQLAVASTLAAVAPAAMTYALLVVVVMVVLAALQPAQEIVFAMLENDAVAS